MAAQRRQPRARPQQGRESGHIDRTRHVVGHDLSQGQRADAPRRRARLRASRSPLSTSCNPGRGALRNPLSPTRWMAGAITHRPEMLRTSISDPPRRSRAAICPWCRSTRRTAREQHHHDATDCATGTAARPHTHSHGFLPFVFLEQRGRSALSHRSALVVRPIGPHHAELVTPGMHLGAGSLPYPAEAAHSTAMIGSSRYSRAVGP